MKIFFKRFAWYFLNFPWYGKHAGIRQWAPHWWTKWYWKQHGGFQR